MLKKVTVLLAIVLLTASVSQAQWTNQGAWPVNPPADALYKTGQNHATAVDPDGKVWVGRYSNVATTLFTNPETGKPLRLACYLTYVFNPDGSQASFSPIFQVMGDTMYGATQRGMRTYKDGNILLVIGATSPNGAMMYMIDYKTGKGLKKVMLAPLAAGASTAPCWSDDGTIFVAPVSPGAFPLSMYDKDLKLIGTAVQTTLGFSRSFEVSKDGNTIYWAGYTNGEIYVYKRADEFSQFELLELMLPGMACESFTWHPKTGQLWMSAGSNNDKPKPPYTIGTWYAYDFTKKKVVDSLKWKFADPAAPNERPRALAFSPDGNTAYIGSFGLAATDLVQKVVFTGTSVRKTDELPTGYDLSQNYPNPFNPTTNIKFSIPEEGFVSLKVYNTLGQEVAALVNEVKSAGTYHVDFDASNLSTGMYIYTLSSGAHKISKKMLLVK